MKSIKSSSKSGSNFVVQGSILAIAGILVRVIGLLYRIPLIRIIGDEGMGYYSTAYNVYAIMLLLSSYSLPLAVSKMVSARLGKDEYINANRILKAALLYATLVGFIGTMAVIYYSGWLSNSLFHLPLSQYAMLTLAPTIWIMAYLGVFRGYFQGRSTMVPTAISQILEQIVNAFVSVSAAWFLCQYAIINGRDSSTIRAFGASGGTIGTGAGAVTALVVLIFLFILETKSRKLNIQNDSSGRVEGYFTISRILFFTVIPVILSTAVYNINSIIDNAIFGHVMDGFGEIPETIANNYGVYSGKYLLLINVPVAIANSLSSSLIPTLANSVAKRQRKEVRRKISIAIRFAMLVGIPSAVGLAVLAEPIMHMLFGKNDLAVALLQVGSVAVVFYSLSTVSNAILQGTNHMSIPVRNAVYSLIIHTVSLYIMLYVFKMGLYGLVFANIVFAFCMCIFNAAAIKYKLHYKQEILKTYLGPALCSLIMGVCTYFVYALVSVRTRRLYSTVISILVAIFVYTISILLTKSVGEEDLRAMPMGRSLVKILKKIHLL
jgi:hypothetical protein